MSCYKSSIPDEMWYSMTNINRTARRKAWASRVGTCRCHVLTEAFEDHFPHHLVQHGPNGSLPLCSRVTVGFNRSHLPLARHSSPLPQQRHWSTTLIQWRLIFAVGFWRARTEIRARGAVHVVVGVYRDMVSWGNHGSSRHGGILSTLHEQRCKSDCRKK